MLLRLLTSSPHRLYKVINYVSAVFTARFVGLSRVVKKLGSNELHGLWPDRRETETPHRPSVSLSHTLSPLWHGQVKRTETRYSCHCFPTASGRMMFQPVASPPQSGHFFFPSHVFTSRPHVRFCLFSGFKSRHQNIFKLKSGWRSSGGLLHLVHIFSAGVFITFVLYGSGLNVNNLRFWIMYFLYVLFPTSNVLLSSHPLLAAVVRSSLCLSSRWSSDRKNEAVLDVVLLPPH